MSPTEFALRDDILRRDAVDALFTWLLGQECQAELFAHHPRKEAADRVLLPTVAFMMAAIVVPLGCLSRARTASCLVSPRVEAKGMFPGFAALFAPLLARANLVFVGVLLSDI